MNNAPHPDAARAAAITRALSKARATASRDPDGALDAAVRLGLLVSARRPSATGPWIVRLVDQQTVVIEGVVRLRALVLGLFAGAAPFLDPGAVEAALEAGS